MERTTSSAPKALLEASGSLVSAWVIRGLREAGFLSVASDIREDTAGYHLADEWVVVPRASDPNLWNTLNKILEERGIAWVFPSLDETLSEWADRRRGFVERGVTVVVSPAETIRTFQDKWKTYQFFVERGIPTPETSLEPRYRLAKPRFGRGGKGIRIIEPDSPPVFAEPYIFQEFIHGQEYTVDVLVDIDGKLAISIPRKRLRVVDGKAIDSITVDHGGIRVLIERIVEAKAFLGPINVQVFETPDGKLFVTEVNPRLGGGMALGFAASQNWFEYLRLRYEGRAPQLAPVRWNLKMLRYYNELFV